MSLVGLCLYHLSHPTNSFTIRVAEVVVETGRLVQGYSFPEVH